MGSGAKGQEFPTIFVPCPRVKTRVDLVFRFWFGLNIKAIYLTSTQDQWQEKNHMQGRGTAMATKFPSSSSRTCLCPPTSYPGSFRCDRHHRSPAAKSRDTANSQSKPLVVLANNVGTSIKTTGLLKDFLMQIIKPSGHDLQSQTKSNLQPKPTMFSLINSATNADDGLAVSLS